MFKENLFWQYCSCTVWRSCLFKCSLSSSVQYFKNHKFVLVSGDVAICIAILQPLILEVYRHPRAQPGAPSIQPPLTAWTKRFWKVVPHPPQPPHAALLLCTPPLTERLPCVQGTSYPAALSIKYFEPSSGTT